MAAGRIWSVARDARDFKRARIRDGDMAVEPAENHGMIRRDGIEILAGGKFLFRPQSVIPSAPENPFARFVILQARANPVLKFGDRLYAGEINLQFRVGRAEKMDMGIVEAGHGEFSAQINYACIRTNERLDLGCLFRFDGVADVVGDRDD